MKTNKQTTHALKKIIFMLCLLVVGLSNMYAQNPDIPTVDITTTPIACAGNPVLIQWTGSLNDAAQWHIYTGSCGGTEIGTTTSNSLGLSSPSSAGSITYFVRGEGGGVTPGSCGSDAITTVARENADFSYSSASYLPTDADPTPTITGVGGGDFTRSPAGLIINTSTGEIDVSASTPGVYTVTYESPGTCDGEEDRTVTIVAPTVTLSLSSNSFTENAAGVITVTATSNIVAGLPITVTIAATGTATGSGTDYSLLSTSITIPAGSTSGSTTIIGVDDAIDEADETVIVDITGVVNGNEAGLQQETISIIDDDPAPTVTLNFGGGTLTESGSTATMNVVLSTVSGRDVTVTLGKTGTATANVDYTMIPTSIITIPAGSTIRTVTMTGEDDTIDEPTETIIIDITGVTNGTELGAQQVNTTITDDDAAPTVTLGLSGSPLAEDGGVATITATLGGTTSSQAVTVTIATTGTATGSGTDYNLSNTITIPAGSTTGTATITGVDDTINEPDETVIVDIIGVVNGTESGTQQVTASITDDDLSSCITFSAPVGTTNTWMGCADSNWSNGANWSTGVAPTASDVVYVPNNPDNPLIINQVATCAKLVVEIGGVCKVDYNAGGKLIIEF